MSVEVQATVRVLFFGRVADVMGREVELAIPGAGAPVRELRGRLAAMAGGDILLRPGVRASIDRQVAGEDAWAHPGAEVAFFSVFSGG